MTNCCNIQRLIFSRNISSRVSGMWNLIFWISAFVESLCSVILKIFSSWATFQMSCLLLRYSWSYFRVGSFLDSIRDFFPTSLKLSTWKIFLPLYYTCLHIRIVSTAPRITACSPAFPYPLPSSSTTPFCACPQKSARNSMHILLIPAFDQILGIYWPPSILPRSKFDDRHLAATSNEPWPL